VRLSARPGREGEGAREGERKRLLCLEERRERIRTEGVGTEAHCEALGEAREGGGGAGEGERMRLKCLENAFGNRYEEELRVLAPRPSFRF